MIKKQLCCIHTSAQLLITGLMIIATMSGTAQPSDNDKNSWAIKAHVNYLTTFGSGFSFGSVAPTLQLMTKRQNVHEVELNDFRVSKSTTSLYDTTYLGENTHKAFVLALRYQYTLTFAKHRKFNPQIGFSLLNRYSFDHNIPSGTDTYERTANRWSSTFALVPQLRYNITSRFFLDLGIPFDLFIFGASFQRISNPNIPIRQQRNGGFDSDQFPNKFDYLRLRLGAGIKL